ncbi:hypothetical protein D3C87_1514990 [compost metagenome]
MTWGIDDVNLVTLPKTRNSSGSNRDSTFFFLSHPVSGSTVAFTTDFADLVVDTSTVENTFCSGGLTRINVRDNTDVTKVL